MKNTLFVASGLLLTMLLAGCGGGGGTSESSRSKDETKTQLYVSNFNGGFGDTWLKKAIARFESQNSETSFESGKKGVQVYIQDNKTNATELMSTLKDTISDVFFAEGIYYYDYIAKGLLLDISDVVTDSMADLNETRTIEEKMSDSQKAFYKTDDGKYYGIPHYSGFSGITYDVDLFDEENLYFASSDDGSFVDSKDAAKSKGPDGAAGTRDDGLPATYDDFFTLLDHMSTDLGITPMVWNGQYYNTYLENLLFALQNDYEGLGNGMLNYTFSGNDKTLISEVDSDGNYTFVDSINGTSITKENAFKVYSEAGRYESLKFLERLVRNNSYYTNMVFSPSFLHTEAQLDFVESRPKGSPIGMIVEGAWWEEEAKDNIAQVADFYGQEYSRENRHFAFMPLPKANEGKIGEKSTLSDTLNSLCFIKSNVASEKVKVAKSFLKFVNSDASLSEFTTTTNSVKALDYTIDQAAYDSLDYYGKSVYDAKISSDILYPYSKENMFIDNVSFFNVYESFKSDVGGTTETRPILYFRNSKDNHANAFFNGMEKFRESVWESTFSKYFD